MKFKIFCSTAMAAVMAFSSMDLAFAEELFPASVETAAVEEDGKVKLMDDTYDYKVDGGYIHLYKIMDSQAYWKVTSCDKSVTSADIPDEIDGIPVTSIGNSAFSYCESLTSVNIPDGVTSIGGWAFYNCKSLASINIPKGVTSIGNWAFNYCTNLTSINIPDSVTSIGKYAFNNCTSVTSMDIPYGVTSIDEYTFSYCTNLTSINIPDSVTSIGADAFSHCTNLTSINIPDSVTYIGNEAFCVCTSLTSINIPDGVTSIGEGAFNFCTSLTSINIPDGVTFIGNWAFSYCYSLTSINIPDGVTSIGDHAFEGCSSLTSMDIPYGVTSINEGTFDHCENLTSINIPDGVTFIGDRAFYYCENLTSINIPYGVTSIGDRAFCDCTSLTSINIPYGVTSIGDDAFFDCYKLESVTIPSSVTSIGKGAFTIKYNKIFYNEETDTVDRLYITYYVVPGSAAESYFSELNSEITDEIEKYKYVYYDDGSYDDGSVPKEDEKKDSEITIRSVTIHYGGRKIDILNGSLAVTEGDEGIAEIEYEIDWGEENASDYNVYLKLGKDHLNSFTICPGTDLSPSDLSGIVVMKKSPETEDEAIAAAEQINLTVLPKYVPFPKPKPGEVDVVAEDENKWKLEFPVFDDFGFDIDEENFLSKVKFSIETNPVNADFELDTEEKTFTCTIGAPEDEDDGDKNEKHEEKYKQWRSAVEKSITDIKSSEKGASKTDIIKKNFAANGFNNKFSKITLTKGWGDPDFSVTGYIEGELTEDGKSIKSASGKIVGTASIKYEYKGQAYVSAVPVVYGVSVGGGVEGTIELKIDSPLDPENIRKSLEGSIVLTPELGITGGVGIVNIAELSATGKASLPIEIHTHENYQKVEFTAEAELNLYLGTFNIAKATTPKYTKKIYETAVATPYSFDEHESIYDKIDLNAPLTPMDRAYAARSSVWQGENSVKLYSDNALDVLQTNIYPEAHPIITEADGKKIIMWTADDTARDEYNRSVLVYSVYDESTGTWSAPTAVYDDGNLDLAPEIKNGYVVWQKANRKITSSDSLTDLSKSFDIYVAKFNGTGFDAPTRLTDDSELDSQPSIDVIDGKAVVVWSKNTESDIFGTNGVNSIMLSEFTNGTWSAPTALASGLNAIDSVSVGYMNDRPVTVCSIDTDNSIETTDDRELFVIENGDITQFTNDDVIDTKPQFVYLNNKNTLFWYSNGEIAYVNTFDDPVFSAIPVNTGTDDVRIASDGEKAAVFYTVPDDNGSEVYASLFDGVQWSQGIQLTETDGRSLYPSGIFDKNGTIITAFNRISENGQADLCTVELTPACDIEIGELYAGTFKTNSEVPVLFNIKNTGEKPVDTIKIELIDSEGNVNYTETVKETLQPGEIYEAETVFTTGETLPEGKLTARISTTETEKTLENNVSETEIKADGQDTKTFRYGDVDVDNAITASDSAYILQKALKSTFELPIQKETDDWLKYADVDVNGNITANDASCVIQKTLVSTFEMPAEKK